ncbi:3-deoxy-D-manno-octulosonic acid transferase [Fimbriimonas ginsengisoli]|uniref:3-deoxy-D-manno-octulosonic acid transferase n=1 Tax=Fimbriimonas ginsengisoli Gsoil 348 TaxID=661478 RepID=A0A068NSG8_FIMGI|nr:glycosyltransferase N-terminal domain-containing protein [Fimbriimonas ginsengisoli]AIE86297.1 tetraacyldisaccharide 4'-kinase [Fimbriimonas ginsengisoli Gsoil 348]
MFILYNFLLTILAPIWVPWMLLRARRRNEGVNWKERQGSYTIPPRGDRPRIWFHAVSVGEVVASMPILTELRQALPNHEIVLSVTTSSGHQTAREKAAGLFDYLVYFPIDVARFQLAAMQRVRPDVVAIMETELWMNFLWAAKTFDARTLLINGRISDKNFRRSKKLPFYYRALLRDMDRCLMQADADAERIRFLGAREVEVLGNSKFDQALEGLDADPAIWRRELGIDPAIPVVVVGSLRAEEFDFVTQALPSDAQIVIAPRHVEKGDDLEKTLGTGVARRSRNERLSPARVLILDTYGELAKIYSVADIVVIGGGFADLGGQNIIQPLAHGKPVIHGPHMQNFRDVAAQAHEGGATIIASTPEELRNAIRDLLADRSRQDQLGVAAQQIVRRNAGASRRYASAIAAEAARAPKVSRRRGETG